MDLVKYKKNIFYFQFENAILCNVNMNELQKNTKESMYWDNW